MIRMFLMKLQLGGKLFYMMLTVLNSGNVNVMFRGLYDWTGFIISLIDKLRI